MTVLSDLLNLGGPFFEAFAQQLVAKTAPEVKDAGKEATGFLKQKLLGTATTADDTVVLGNLKAFAEGVLEEINAPAADPAPAPEQPTG